MRTKLLLPLLFLALFTFQANAQEVGDIRLGGGLVFGTSTFADLGLNVRGDYQFTETIKGGVDFTYFFANEFYSLSTVNLNGFYYFDAEGFNPYALAGINISIYSFPSFFGENASFTDVSLNLGGGADFPISENLAAFGEVKYVVSGIDQLVLTGGVKFLLGN